MNGANLYSSVIEKCKSSSTLIPANSVALPANISLAPTIISYIYVLVAPVSGLNILSNVYLTSSVVKSLPSLNFTPSFNSKE